MRGWKYILAMLAIGSFATGSMAQLSFDFESPDSLNGWVGTIAPPGAATNYSLSTDQAYSGTQSLYVGADTYVDFDFGSNQYGLLTMWVYEPGAIGLDGQYGPRWGLASETVYDHGHSPDGSILFRSMIGGGLVWKSFLGGEGGYGYSYGQNTADGRSWFSPAWHGGPRIREEWMQWEIAITQDDAGDIATVKRVGGTTRTNTVEGAFSVDSFGARSINIYGGNSTIPLFGSDVTGIYIDDIVWTPATPPDPRLEPFETVGTHVEIRSDQAVSGTDSLYLGSGDRAYLRFADAPVFGSIEMKVFDRGASDIVQNSAYGPRFGVLNNDSANPAIPTIDSAQDCMIGAGIAWRDNIDGNNGYVYTDGIAGSNGVQRDALYSPLWAGGPRRVSVQPTRTDPNDPLSTPIDGEGDWATWKIEVHEGGQYSITINPGEADEQIIVINNDDPNTPDTDEGMDPTSIFYDSVADDGRHTGFNELFLFGGIIDDEGVWIDDIVFTPDPGQGVDGFSMNFEEGLPCRDHNAAFGDFNCDDEVNLLDLTTLGENYNSIGLDPETSYLLGDTNADGEVNLLDLTTLGENYNSSVPTVPEPATLGLLAIGGLLAIRRR